MSTSNADVRAPAFDGLGPVEYLDTATLIAQLEELGQLRDAGVLSEAESEVQKARVLHR
jgi:hypothetical protein